MKDEYIRRQSLLVGRRLFLCRGLFLCLRIRLCRLHGKKCMFFFRTRFHPTRHLSSVWALYSIALFCNTWRLSWQPCLVCGARGEKMKHGYDLCVLLSYTRSRHLCCIFAVLAGCGIFLVVRSCCFLFFHRRYKCFYTSARGGIVFLRGLLPLYLLCLSERRRFIFSFFPGAPRLTHPCAIVPC